MKSQIKENKLLIKSNYGNMELSENDIDILLNTPEKNDVMKTFDDIIPLSERDTKEDVICARYSYLKTKIRYLKISEMSERLEKIYENGGENVNN